jgi:hypothetical protein
MRKLFFLILLPINLLAQDQVKFDSAYTHIMSVARQWEATPEQIISINQRHYFGGKEIIVSVKYTIDGKKMKRKEVTEISNSGVRFKKI